MPQTRSLSGQADGIGQFDSQVLRGGRYHGAPVIPPQGSDKVRQDQN